MLVPFWLQDLGSKADPNFRTHFGPQILGQRARWPRQQGWLRASIANITLQTGCTRAHSILERALVFWTCLLPTLFSGGMLLLLRASRKQAAHVVSICYGIAKASLGGACCLRVHVCHVHGYGQVRQAAAAAAQMAPSWFPAPCHKHCLV